jgi:hypothetical protein
LPGGVPPTIASKSGNVSTAKAKAKPKAEDKAVPAEVKGTPEEPLYAKYEKMLMDEREAAKANKEQAMYARLVEAGLGTMAGGSQYALENLAKGALPAIKGYGEDVRGARAEERARIKDLLGIEGMRQEAQRSAKEMALKEVPQFYPIELKFLMKLKEIPCSLYLMMKDGDYIIIGRKGDKIVEHTSKIMNEGVETLFVNRLDRLLVINAISESVVEFLAKACRTRSIKNSRIQKTYLSML